MKMFKPKFRVKKIVVSGVITQYVLEYKTWYKPFWTTYNNHVYSNESSAMNAFEIQKAYRDTKETILISEE
jgi:hypothetical protein